MVREGSREHLHRKTPMPRNAVTQREKTPMPRNAVIQRERRKLSFLFVVSTVIIRFDALLCTQNLTFFKLYSNMIGSLIDI